MTRRQFTRLGLSAAALAAASTVMRGDAAGASVTPPVEFDDEVRRTVGLEVDRSIRWLWDYSNADERSGGYGIVRDRDDSAWVASIAATGFALAAWCVGVERGVLDRRAVTKRIRGALRTLEVSVPHRQGMMMHFVSPTTAAAASRSEYSTIDTTLALNGAIVAAQYLQDADISQITNRLLQRADWLAYTASSRRRSYLRMGWSDETQDFVGSWDMSAEQLTTYFLIAGHPGVPTETARALYRDFSRPSGTYGGYQCVYEPGGTLFTYHYSHAFFPFQNWRDSQGFDWFDNSRRATLANRAWCQENAARFRSFEVGLWGSSASDGPSGYTVNGAEPCVGLPRNDGTIPAYSLLGSLLFAPEEAASAIRILRRDFPAAWGRYGFADAVAHVGDRPWIATSRLGIDKGFSAIAGAAALGSTLVWDGFSTHPWVARGRRALDFRAA